MTALLWARHRVDEIMHPIQQKLLSLSRSANLAKLSLREMAREIDLPDESPQKIKHHLSQLEKKGFVLLDRSAGLMARSSNTGAWAKGLETANVLFAVPIIGTANCGPATLYAEENFEGFLRVSANLLGRSRPSGLYAIRASGSSMNRAEVAGRRIESGDFVIVDSRATSPRHNDIVVAIIDDKATIKRFIDDRANDQVVLRAESTTDYEPIHLHADDDFRISGKVVAVVKTPA